ncbi:hypothetical protein QTP88_003114 [Uroleucon formosanum]
MVKNLPAKTIIQLTHIYNATLRFSYFPLTWKSATIIPILNPSKPPDKADSYRPISLLPMLGKILEKILLKRLFKISKEQNALPDFQFGFRPKYATFHQLHRVVDLIASSLETKKYCSAVFLDVAQALDSVWHAGLLYKLKKIYPAPYYLLLKSYIENRSFNLKIDSTFSNSYDILAGVPKGSDIAPFLYIIFTADIPTTENTIMGTYADDTAILAANSDPHICSHHLQNHLNMLTKWCNAWKIKIYMLVKDLSAQKDVVNRTRTNTPLSDIYFLNVAFIRVKVILVNAFTQAIKPCTFVVYCVFYIQIIDWTKSKKTGNYTCPNKSCNKIYKSKGFQSEYRRQSNLSISYKFTCPNCCRRYSHKPRLVHHLKHECGYKRFIYSDIKQLRFICPNNCGKSYKIKRSVGRHLKFKCGVEPMFECRICHKKFALKESMKKHVIQKHDQHYL